MTPNEVKIIANGLVESATHFLKSYFVRTEDDTPTVAVVVQIPDNSTGFIDMRYAATVIEGAALGFYRGTERYVFKKTAGALIVDTGVTDTDQGGTELAAAAIAPVNEGDNIGIELTGAPDDPTSWHITMIINCAPAPEIET